MCTALISVIIQEGVTSIGPDAFSHCALTSVTIQEGVTSIGHGAFSHCASLTSVTIPDSVTSIGEHAFSNCDSLTLVSLVDANSNTQKFKINRDQNNVEYNPSYLDDEKKNIIKKIFLNDDLYFNYVTHFDGDKRKSKKRSKKRSKKNKNIK